MGVCENWLGAMFILPPCMHQENMQSHEKESDHFCKTLSSESIVFVFSASWRRMEGVGAERGRNPPTAKSKFVCF